MLKHHSSVTDNLVFVIKLLQHFLWPLGTTSQHPACFQLAVGHLLDKFPRRRHCLLFAAVSLYGAPVMFVASAARSVELFLALWFVSGVGSGGLVTGCSVLCLDIWRGRGKARGA